MVARLTRGLCRFLVLSVALLSFQSAWAGMIGTEQAMTAASAQSDRAAVQHLLNRAELQKELVALGVDPSAVRDRVEAMTDDEVRTLAGDLQTAPAGGVWGWIVLAGVILVAFMIWGSTGTRR